MSAHNVVANMNVGWNLGNTFDAVGTASNGLFDWDNMHTMTSSNIINIETAWIGGTSNRTTPELIRAVKAAGFDTLRIPVTWWKATNANSGNLSGNTYQINSAFMARVKEVVDMAIAADMYVILNTHHEERVMPLGSSGRTQAIRTVDVLWTQIAREFRNYDHRLVFAGLNEPREIGGEGEWWGGTSTTRETLNLMNQAFVDRVRADGASGSGNNNRWRILAVPTYAAGANPDSPVFVGFRIPTDTSSGAVNKIIMAIHTYSPFDWAHNGRGSYGSGGNDLARIRRDLDFVRTQARNLGVPVVLSEWGSVNAGQMSQRVTHAEDYVREARARGMATVWWDNASADTRANEHGFGLFSRRAPHAPSLSYGGQTYNFQQIIDAIMRGRRATFTPS
jgi:endoglucanase